MENSSMNNFKKLNLFQATILAALLSGFANVFAFSIVKLMHIGVFIPLQPGVNQLNELSLDKVILATVVPAFIAGGIFALLKKFTPKKAMTHFLFISLGSLIFSFFSPFALQVSLANKLILCAFHVIAGIFIFGTFYNFEKMKK